MTEETQQSEVAAENDVGAVQNDTQTNLSDVGKVRDNKKEKCRPMTKVVIRRLPPTMTQEQFLEQISPLPEHDYFYFVKADMSLGQFAFSRAYINFTDQQDIFVFREKFDNYVFIDAKGVEYPAVVEFAPFQRLARKRHGRKKDLKCGTIESDSYYISFLESLKNQEIDSNVAQSKTEYSYQPPDNTTKKVTTTPLLEYLKQRKQEKQRLRDEKREERRRRDLERRRTKDDPIISKQTYNTEVNRSSKFMVLRSAKIQLEELLLPKFVENVLKNPDLDRESSKDDKENKDERDKLSPKDLKNRTKRDDKVREKSSRDRETKPILKGYRDERNKDRDLKQRRYDEKKLYGRRDDREGVKEDKRIDLRDERKYEAKEDRKVEEKRGKSYEKMRQEKKKLAETKKQMADANVSEASPKKTREEHDSVQEVEDVTGGNVRESARDDEDSKHARDNERVQRNATEDRVTGEDAPEDRRDIAERGNSVDNADANEDDGSESKMESKVVKRRSSLESGGEGGTGDGNCLRRHKSLDGGGQSNLQKNESEEKEKDKKDPRLERRIRNKDRPAMEIYRPGMGKFSKQRLEREKSNNDERASLSQSPTPNPGASTSGKSGKSATEVRSMTFKRSVSRDVA
ncbi:regulator of nonsense transcripts 3A isoform X2 [Harpegnathos saltator]|uniref:regulator of nonsense transcripts 3A isoform X2 n=1 Tax=Harpegnathos saltator TaxID=610380 RepID=UPI00058CF49F|nr:regulator of nonsense transcripts 3A isoform X2 [Harpegnathos saltator]